MEYPIPELLDRFSITQLKLERIGEVECFEEFNKLKVEVDTILNNYNIKEHLNKLYNINAEIWDLESDIRKGLDEKLGMDEIGRRAIAIRGKNKIRVSIKNEISTITGSGFKDVKMNHISE